MVVAYYFPTNEDIHYGVVMSSGFDSGIALVDGYEVDAEIRSFDTLDEARVWLKSEHSVEPANAVRGGIIGSHKP